MDHATKALSTHGKAKHSSCNLESGHGRDRSQAVPQDQSGHCSALDPLLELQQDLRRIADLSCIVKVSRSTDEARRPFVELHPGDVRRFSLRPTPTVINRSNRSRRCSKPSRRQKRQRQVSVARGHIKWDPSGWCPPNMSKRISKGITD